MVISGNILSQSREAIGDDIYIGAQATGEKDNQQQAYQQTGGEHNDNPHIHFPGLAANIFG